MRGDRLGSDPSCAVARWPSWWPWYAPWRSVRGVGRPQATPPNRRIGSVSGLCHEGAHLRVPVDLPADACPGASEARLNESPRTWSEHAGGSRRVPSPA